MRDFFLLSPWPGTIAWAVLYLSDYALTISCARLRRRSVSSKVVIEGSFELNPMFQSDVDSMKFVSPRFLLLLLLNLTLITTFWILWVPSSAGLYTFMLGAGICLELGIHVRHLQNLYLYSSRSTTEQLRGRIEYARPLILRLSSVQALAFAGLFGALFAFTGSLFLAGGTVSCFALSAKHWYLARCAANRSVKREQALAGQPMG
jgi:hypothetical protein